MADAAARGLDPDKVFIVKEGDLEFARILAEETDVERRARRAAARAAPEESDHTVAEIDAMSWDELLVLDGECFIRCCNRSGLAPRDVLDFVEAQCEPANRLAVRWFGVLVRTLSEGSEDAASVAARLRGQSAKNAANARHDQPGGSRWNRMRIQEIWASGKYSSRDLCADQEAAALGMSPSTARKALRGMPDPG